MPPRCLVVYYEQLQRDLPAELERIEREYERKMSEQMAMSEKNIGVLDGGPVSRTLGLSGPVP